MNLRPWLLVKFTQLSCKSNSKHIELSLSMTQAKDSGTGLIQHSINNFDV